ncbi:MAG: hypothetical protein AB9846_05350 [Tenuifilaceae bacterium]
MKLSFEKLLFFLLSFTFVVFSCQKLDIQKIMVLKTKSVIEITATTASVKGEVVDLGDGITDYGVYYSTTANAKAGTKVSLGKPNGAGEFTATLTGLKASTKYYVCVYGARNNSFVYGDEVDFTTLGTPTITTTEATAITPISATVGGSVTFDGGANVTDRGVYWRMSASPDTIGTKLQVGNGSGVFTTLLSDLSPNTSYTFRAYATNQVGTGYGTKQHFTTDIAVPILSTSSVINISSTTAICGGNITSDGGDQIAERGVCWSLIANPTTSEAKTINGTGIGVFTSNLTDLSPGKSYHVRAYATNSTKTGYGEDVVFATLAIPPTVTTSIVSNITLNSIISGGNVTADGGSGVTARGICWGLLSNPTVIANKTIDGTGVGTFSSNITSLLPGTTYHIRAYATNNIGTNYGEDIVFSTLSGVITISTTSMSSILANTASSGGYIASDGGGAISARGICWNLNANPTTLNSKTLNGTGIGSYTSNLKDLLPSTKYYVRAYATNVTGTYYGEEISFTTLIGPNVTTDDVTSITATKATCGGNVTDIGLSPVIARGVCWSSNPNPTIYSSITQDGSGLGSFISSLTNLYQGTTYYIRAYATNTEGTSYGIEKEFITGVLPTVQTLRITSITSNSAIWEGEVTNNGSSTVSQRGFYWDTEYFQSYSGSVYLANGTGIGIYSGQHIYLSPGTTYYVRAWAKNDAGTAYGNLLTFRTP